MITTVRGQLSVLFMIIITKRALLTGYIDYNTATHPLTVRILTDIILSTIRILTNDRRWIYVVP